jgi:hypothetical protein
MEIDPDSELQKKSIFKEMQYEKFGKGEYVFWKYGD